MDAPVQNNQSKFFKHLSLFSKPMVLPGKKIIDISHFKNLTGFELPQDLMNLYLAHDGQIPAEKGIFKALYGYDMYTRPHFLNYEQMLALWKYLCEYEDLDVFKQQFIPFACDELEFRRCDNIYCLDALTGEVHLLAIAAPDWTLPAEWQQHREKRAQSLDAFFAYQLNLY